MKRIKYKKYYGQNFLTDDNIAKKIVKSISLKNYDIILEIGSGMGALTKHLVNIKKQIDIIEIDQFYINYIKNNINCKNLNLYHCDFLKFNIDKIYSDPICIVGNFPYNISSKIIRKIIDNRSKIAEVCGMFQKELAKRICSKYNTKEYGIISILAQTYYDCKYLFDVSEKVFNPIPKVKSGVILMTKKDKNIINIKNELTFLKIIKKSFNQRRKKLYNSLNIKKNITKNIDFINKRPEQITIDEFMYLARLIDEKKIIL